MVRSPVQQLDWLIDFICKLHIFLQPHGNLPKLCRPLLYLLAIFTHKLSTIFIVTMASLESTVIPWVEINWWPHRSGRQVLNFCNYREMWKSFVVWVLFSFIVISTLNVKKLETWTWNSLRVSNKAKVLNTKLIKNVMHQLIFLTIILFTL